MASTPQFTTVVNNGIATLGPTNGIDGTNRDGSGTTTAAPILLFTAGASGSRVNQLVVKATVDPADCVVIIFIKRGSSFYNFAEFDIGNPATGSTTVAAYEERRKYNDLILESGDDLYAIVTVAPTTGVINVFAFGGDF